MESKRKKAKTGAIIDVGFIPDEKRQISSLFETSLDDVERTVIIPAIGMVNIRFSGIPKDMYLIMMKRPGLYSRNISRLLKQ